MNESGPPPHPQLDSLLSGLLKTCGQEGCTGAGCILRTMVEDFNTNAAFFRREYGMKIASRLRPKFTHAVLLIAVVLYVAAQVPGFRWLAPLPRLLMLPVLIMMAVPSGVAGLFFNMVCTYSELCRGSDLEAALTGALDWVAVHVSQLPAVARPWLARAAVVHGVAVAQLNALLPDGERGVVTGAMIVNVGVAVVCVVGLLVFRRCCCVRDKVKRD